METKSHITVLVDLSATWLSPASKNQNQRVLTSISQAVSSLVPKLKAPVSVRYLEIGDASLARPPLCEVRYSPNIFRDSKDPSEVADLDVLGDMLSEDCVKAILMHRPAAFTDITGALNTVSRLAATQASEYDSVIVLSDFKEERRQAQVDALGQLPKTKVLLVYRVLENDRFNSTALDQRLSDWQARLKKAGAKATAVNDVTLEPAQLRRLLTQ